MTETSTTEIEDRSAGNMPFNRHASGNTGPLVAQPEIDTDENEKISTKGAFQTASISPDLNPKKKERSPAGFSPLEDGTKIWDGTPQTSFSDAIGQFFQLLMALFSGNMEDFYLKLDGPGGFKDTYVDPIERGVSTLPKKEQKQIIEMDKTIERARLTISPDMSGFERLQALSQDAGIQNILGVIVKYETKAGGDFDMANGGSRPLINGKPASQATIAEVLDAQKNYRQWPGAASSALGAFQIIRATLEGAVKNLGLDPEKTLFNQQTQTLIALHLIDKSVSDYEKNGDKAKLINAVGNIWSSIPLDESGKAAHGGLANNPSFVPVSRYPEIKEAVHLIGTPAVPGIQKL
ncbi:MAG: hypothetical protein IT559_03025 [Alphaproteobacteria bacterium]|nr:hypothetical protein [Alphaproteobacteria bacterium]